jgi:hypothetical protein
MSESEAPQSDAAEKTTTEFDGSNEVEITTNWDEVVSSFDAMDLKEELLRGIFAYGFEKPSAIQQVSKGSSRPVIGSRESRIPDFPIRSFVPSFRLRLHASCL